MSYIYEFPHPRFVANYDPDPENEPYDFSVLNEVLQDRPCTRAACVVQGIRFCSGLGTRLDYGCEIDVRVFNTGLGAEVRQT